MGCNCGKTKGNLVRDPQDIMGGYKYLNDRQIKARIEVYKKKYCKDCNRRYECGYSSYIECKKNKK